MMNNPFTKEQIEKSHKNCELFIEDIKKTGHFPKMMHYMKQFKKDSSKSHAFQIFMDMHNYIKNSRETSLEEKFSDCLIPEAFMMRPPAFKPKIIKVSQKKPSRVAEKPEKVLKPEKQQKVVKQVKVAPPPPVVIIPKVIIPPKVIVAPVIVPKPVPQALSPQLPYQEITEDVFRQRIHSIPQFNKFAKFIYLYLKCIITLGQLKELAIKLLPRTLVKFFMQSASDIEAPRRNGSFFVSLNHLSQSELKNRIGASYVQMPKGYANHCNDHTLPLHVKKTLNREWVSMPLGTEFKNTKKNQYEEEMFKLEEERFEIDSTIMTFRKCLKQLQTIQSNDTFYPSNILQRTLYRVYGTGEAYYYLELKPKETVKLVFSRIQQKLSEIEHCRKKSLKCWQEGAFKNFQKSLDHRSYYFENSEKKFNLSTARWDKQTEFRHKFYINPATLNPDSFNTDFSTTVDTFQNLTIQKCIQSKVVNLCFPKAKSFIEFPYNKILYAFDFSDSETLNDVIGVISSKVNKKSSLQYLLLKLLKIDVLKILELFEQQMKNFQRFKQLETLKNNQDSFSEEQELEIGAAKKQKKKVTDINQQFCDMIEEEGRYLCYNKLQSPFEGPKGHIFIGTKANYHFVRYLLIIYQRFIKAKQIIKSIESEDKTGSFLPGERLDRLKGLLMNRSKDSNQTETIRKIFDKNAFMFLTLHKLVERAARIINNPDDVTNNIIRSGMQDYDCKIKTIDKFEIKSELEQLMRVYHEPGVFYRFCWVGPLLYISSWSSIYKQWESKNEVLSRVHRNFNIFATAPTKSYKLNKINKGSSIQAARKRGFQEISSEYLTAPNQVLLMQRGQEFFSSNKSKTKPNNAEIKCQLKRLKKVKQLLNI